MSGDELLGDPDFQAPVCTVSGRLAGDHCHQFSNGPLLADFFCGPLVRFLFRTIFKRQLEKQAGNHRGKTTAAWINGPLPLLDLMQYSC